MRRRRALKALLCGAAVCATGGLLAGCQTGFRRAFNFKLTVEVMTPQGLRTGSSVYEIWAVPMFDPTLPNKGHYASNLIGQAAIIDLRDGPVFALATGEKGIQDSVITALNGNVPPNSDDYVNIIGRLGHASVKAELPRNVALSNGETMGLWPLMVRFRDISDPKSVEQVDPDAIGVRRIWVETTSEPVTTGIQKRLRWLGDRGHLLDSDGGPTTTPLFAQTLNNGAFWQDGDK